MFVSASLRYCDFGPEYCGAGCIAQCDAVQDEPFSITFTLLDGRLFEGDRARVHVAAHTRPPQPTWTVAGVWYTTDGSHPASSQTSVPVGADGIVTVTSSAKEVELPAEIGLSSASTLQTIRAVIIYAQGRGDRLCSSPTSAVTLASRSRLALSCESAESRIRRHTEFACSIFDDSPDGDEADRRALLHCAFAEALRGAGMGRYAPNDPQAEAAALPFRLDLAAILAHISHETGGLTSLVEACSTVAEGRSCAKSYDASPDGRALYFGRGVIQLTWKANYASVGASLGIDLLTDPEAVADLPTLSFSTAIAFWTSARPFANDGSAQDFARAGDFASTTNKVNGALECGYSATAAGRVQQLRRVQLYRRALACFAIEMPAAAGREDCAAPWQAPLWSASLHYQPPSHSHDAVKTATPATSISAPTPSIVRASASPSITGIDVPTSIPCLVDGRCATDEGETCAICPIDCIVCPRGVQVLVSGEDIRIRSDITGFAAHHTGRIVWTAGNRVGSATFREHRDGSGGGDLIDAVAVITMNTASRITAVRFTEDGDRLLLADAGRHRIVSLPSTAGPAAGEPVPMCVWETLASSNHDLPYGFVVGTLADGSAMIIAIGHDFERNRGSVWICPASAGSATPLDQPVLLDSAFNRLTAIASDRGAAILTRVLVAEANYEHPPRQRIYDLTIGAAGELLGRKVLHEFTDSNVDSECLGIDARGVLYVCRAAHVTMLQPNGRIVQVVPVAVGRTAALTFTGTGGDRVIVGGACGQYFGVGMGCVSSFGTTASGTDAYWHYDGSAQAWAGAPNIANGAAEPLQPESEAPFSQAGHADVCGNSVCGADESCRTCARDCTHCLHALPFTFRVDQEQYALSAAVHGCTVDADGSIYTSDVPRTAGTGARRVASDLTVLRERDAGTHDGGGSSDAVHNVIARLADAGNTMEATAYDRRPMMDIAGVAVNPRDGRSLIVVDSAADSIILRSHSGAADEVLCQFRAGSGLGSALSVASSGAILALLASPQRGDEVWRCTPDGGTALVYRGTQGRRIDSLSFSPDDASFIVAESEVSGGACVTTVIEADFTDTAFRVVFTNRVACAEEEDADIPAPALAKQADHVGCEAVRRGTHLRVDVSGSLYLTTMVMHPDHVTVAAQLLRVSLRSGHLLAALPLNMRRAGAVCLGGLSGRQIYVLGPCLAAPYRGDAVAHGNGGVLRTRMEELACADRVHAHAPGREWQAIAMWRSDTSSDHVDLYDDDDDVADVVEGTLATR